MGKERGGKGDSRLCCEVFVRERVGDGEERRLTTHPTFEPNPVLGAIRSPRALPQQTIISKLPNCFPFFSPPLRGRCKNAVGYTLRGRFLAPSSGLSSCRYEVGVFLERHCTRVGGPSHMNFDGWGDRGICSTPGRRGHLPTYDNQAAQLD